MVCRVQLQLTLARPLLRMLRFLSAGWLGYKQDYVKTGLDFIDVCWESGEWAIHQPIILQQWKLEFQVWFVRIAIGLHTS